MATRTESVKVTADVSNFTTKMAAAGAAAKGFAKELDSADSRMGNLVQTGLALAPAFVPLSAVAVPAITALSAGIGAAALGAGTAILAFQGMSDALTAANNYAITPTATNLEALQKKLEAISPAGRDMVVFLQNLRPELQNLQNIAGAGLFPGLQDGLTSMQAILPNVENLISKISTALGDLASQAGKGLDSKFWRDFIDFLSVSSASTLRDFAAATGNVVTGLAALLQAFDPLNRSFTAGLVDATQAFEDWSRGRSSTQGFQDFTAYIRDNGPRVVATLEALGNAIVQIVEAAAPLGGPTLAVIRAMADTLATIADSDVGPILIGVAAGISALSRAMALAEWSKANVAVGLLSRLNTVDFKAIKELPGAALGTVFAGMGDDLANFNSEGIKSTKTTEGLSRGLGSLAKAGAGIAGLTLLATNLGDGLTYSNTAALGLTGAFFGPEGALAGAAIGFFLDTKAADDKLNESLQKSVELAQQAFSDPTDLRGQDEALRKLLGTVQELNQAQEAAPARTSGRGAIAPSDTDRLKLGAYTDEIARQQAAYDSLTTAQQNMRDALSALQNKLDPAPFRDLTGNVGKLMDVAHSAQPALDRLGISWDEFTAIANKGGPEWENLVSQIEHYFKAADTVAGRTKSVADAIAGLDAPLHSAAEHADALKAALDALIDPEMGAQQAADAFTTSIRHLTDDLAKHSRTLRGNSDAAITNRQAIDDRIVALKEDLSAQARAGASSEQLTSRMKSQRDAILNAGQAAGISRGELRDYLAQMNLTPKLIRTIIENTAKAAQVDVQDYKRAGLDSIPASIHTQISVDASGAYATLSQINAYLSGLHDKTITVNVNTGAIGHIADGGLIGPWTSSARHFDSGGRVSGPGGPREDKVPAWLSNGEFVVNAAATARHLDLLRSLNAQKFANGGEVTRALRSFSPQPSDTGRDIRTALQQLEQSLRGIFGHDSPLLKRVDDLGGSLTALAHTQDRAQKSLEGLRSDLHDTKQARRQFGQDVAGTINNDPFGNGLSGFRTQLRADRNDNRKMLHALRRAKAKGLDGPLLRAAAASGDLEFVQELAAESRKGIRSDERLFNARQRAQGQLGDFAATAVYGDRVREQTQAVHHMSARVDHMTRRLDHLDDRLERAVERGAHIGTQAGTEGRNRRSAARRGANR